MNVHTLIKQNKSVSKRILSVLIACAIVFTNFSVFSVIGNAEENTAVEDMRIIKDRLREYYVDPANDRVGVGAREVVHYASEAGEYLDALQADGSWLDVDYNDHTSSADRKVWSPYIALARIQAMATSYINPQSEWYQTDAMLKGVNDAITYWRTYKTSTPKPDNANWTGPWSENWWENSNGINQPLGKTAIMLEDKLLKANKDFIIEHLDRDGSLYESGQNAMWADQNAVFRALVEENETRLYNAVMNGFAYCLKIQTGAPTLEAVQVDNSFFAHGDLYYSHGYGKGLFIDMAFWIYMLNGTKFALPDYILELMAFYMIDGTSWTIRGDIIDIQQGYFSPDKEYRTEYYALDYVSALGWMAISDPARADAYTAIRDNILGDRLSNGNDGNKYMWRSQYMSHMRDGYAANIRMDASWMKSYEFRQTWPDGEKGNLLYWTASGSSVFVVDGFEYTDVYPVFDWTHTPGTTAQNILNTSYDISGKTGSTAGVSNGRYGASAYILNKSGTQGRKGYFFFEDEIVALGAGISSTAAQNIHTTINQSRAAEVTVAGTDVATGIDGVKYTGNWLHNDKIGYVFFDPTDVYVSNKDQKGTVPTFWTEDEQSKASNVFTAWIDHGNKPSGESYAYIVVPDKDKDETEAYADSIPVTVVSNTSDIQAVRHDGLEITQINFYSAGSLEYRSGHTIAVDRACVVMIDESGDEPKLYVAVDDKTLCTDVKVTMEHEDEPATDTILRSLEIPYAGQTMAANEGDNTTVLASSYTGENFPYMIQDDDEDTMWKSTEEKDQWISFTVKDKVIGSVQRVVITWGDEYAVKYKVQVSSNGKLWLDAAEINDGTGGIESVEIGDLGKYIRIVCLESSGGAGYEIKDVQDKTYQNTLMRWSNFEKEYPQSGSRIYADWKVSDSGPTDLTKYKAESLYLCLDVYMEWDNPALETLTNVDGDLKLRCPNYQNPNFTDQEHNYGWFSRTLNLKQGMNRLKLPLAELINNEFDAGKHSRKGEMDWTKTQSIIFTLLNLDAKHPGVTFNMTLYNVRVELDEDYKLELQSLVKRNFIEDEYTVDSYAAYSLAKEEALSLLELPTAADDEYRTMVEKLRAAIEGLERERGKEKVMTFKNMEKTYSISGTSNHLTADWTTADQGITDLTVYDPDRLYLKLDVTFDWDSDLTLKEGDILQLPNPGNRSLVLRCADYNPDDPDSTTGKLEYNYGWNTRYMNSIPLKKGLNKLVLPLGDLIKNNFDSNYNYRVREGMRWDIVNRLTFLLLDIKADYGEAGITMTLANVCIEYDGIIEVLQEDLTALLQDEYNAADYTAASYAEYLAAKEAALAVLAEENPAEEELRDAIAYLTEAIDGLIEKGQEEIIEGLKADLSTLLATVYSADDYTSDSYAVYSTAKTAAETVLAKANPSAGELRSAISALELAISELVEKSGLPIKKGDPNNDGFINIFDIMIIRDHIFGKNELIGDVFDATDVNGDEDVNIFDIMLIRDHIFGKSLIIWD